MKKIVFCTNKKKRKLNMKKSQYSTGRYITIYAFPNGMVVFGVSEENEEGLKFNIMILQEVLRLFRLDQHI